MTRSHVDKIKSVLTSKYWLVASLGGAFFSFFALDRGGVVVFIDACFVVLIINILFGEYRPSKTPAVFLVTLGICSYLLGASLLFNLKTTHYKSIVFMGRMLCVVFAIHCLSARENDNLTKVLFFVFLATAVYWQAAAFYVFKMPFGTFSNPHYLSSFTVLTLPAIVYCLLIAKGWYKFFFAPAFLLDIDLLLRIGSRPAILGLAVGSIIVAALAVKDRWRWIGLLMLFSGFLGLYLSDYAGVYSNFEELIVNLAREERVSLWKASWDMLKDNTLAGWLFGNGIGNIHTVYPRYLIPSLQHLSFPHLHFIEVLHASGIVGAIFFFGGMLLLLVLSLRVSISTDDRNSRMLILCLLVTFVGWIIHSGLTFPFFSKYAQYSFAFILGPLLVLISKKNASTSSTTTS